MIRQHGPRLHAQGAGLGHGRQALHQVIPVVVVPKEKPALDPSGHEVMQDPRRI
ncbi:MAG: hypothetical protein HYZ72_13770 [Deltaproteobacteria bacterium]|nr:hypothetical protein [Deltaproteobacteria bacterium]